MIIDDDYSQYEMCRIVNLAENDAIKQFAADPSAANEENIKLWKKTVADGLGAGAAFSGEAVEVSEESVYAEAFAAKMLELASRSAR